MSKKTKAPYVNDIAEKLLKFNTYRDDKSMAIDLKESLHHLTISELSVVQTVVLGLDFSSFEEKKRPVIYEGDILPHQVLGIVNERKMIRGLVNLADYLHYEWVEGNLGRCKRFLACIRRVCSSVEDKMKDQLYTALNERE